MTIQEFLKTSPLLFDGAMGTYFASKFSGKRPEDINLTHPDQILSIHNAYIEAGSRAIKTNTFGANSTYLEAEFSYVKKVIEAGFSIAKKAAKGRDVFVFADIGPVIAQTNADVLTQYQQIVDVFLSLGAKHFLFETLSSDNQIDHICRYIKQQDKDAFIITQFAVAPDGYTKDGLSGRTLFERINQNDNVDAMGFNCVSGPLHLLEYLKTLPIGEKYVSIMPNAGYPTIANGRTFFSDNATYFGEKTGQLVKTGARIVGGCCGTTPLHIEKAAEVLRKIRTKTISNITASPKPLKKEPVSRKNSLLSRMENGKKIIAVELDPPADTDIAFFMKSAKLLVDSGADCITIADCPIARMRADSSLLAAKLKRELNIIPLPHMTCRDRNLNATKALLLGLSIEEIHNVLIVTGDPIPSAERDEIKSVYNFNSTMLASYITDLNQHLLKHPFTIYGALDVNSLNFDIELKRAQKKVQNGVSVFLTQPILTEDAVENLKKAKKNLPAKILGGIIPIVSYKNACYMNSEISGIRVSEKIISLYKNLNKEEAEDLAVTISQKISKQVAPYSDGFYLMTPFKRVALIQRIIENIKADFI